MSKYLECFIQNSIRQFFLDNKRFDARFSNCPIVCSVRGILSHTSIKSIKQEENK